MTDKQIYEINLLLLVCTSIMVGATLGVLLFVEATIYILLSLLVSTSITCFNLWTILRSQNTVPSDELYLVYKREDGPCNSFKEDITLINRLEGTKGHMVCTKLHSTSPISNTVMSAVRDHKDIAGCILIDSFQVSDEFEDVFLLKFSEDIIREDYIYIINIRDENNASILEDPYSNIKERFNKLGFICVDMKINSRYKFIEEYMVYAINDAGHDFKIEYEKILSM